MRRSIRPGFLIPLMGIAACGPAAGPDAATQPPVDSAAVLSATNGFWNTWVQAAIAGDMAGLEAMVEETVAIDAKDTPPIAGKAQFSAVFGRGFQTMKVHDESITIEQATPVSNELVYQTGNYVETTTTAGKTTTAHGRFAAALHKGADGVWRIGYVMAFPDSIVPAKP